MPKDDADAGRCYQREMITRDQIRLMLIWHTLVCCVISILVEDQVRERTSSLTLMYRTLVASEG